jgi:DNA-binding winged helix-turn-helix (wHTH) protein
MNQAAPSFYEFGPFRLDPLRRHLLTDDTPVPLTPKAFELLLVLVEHRERVIEKDELIERLWPDTVVEEANLTVNMSALRKALGESPAEHRYIVTVPGRGYRFVATVNEVWEESPDLIVEQHTSSSIVIEQEEGSDAATGGWGDAASESDKESGALSPSPSFSISSSPSFPASPRPRVPASPPLSLPPARSRLRPRRGGGDGGAGCCAGLLLDLGPVKA